MALTRTDVEAIQGLASRLKVDPGSLGGLMEMESGINANIWGGAGGRYRGLIQFGPGARSEVKLPDRQMTVAEQIPYVESYFKQRGFQPGKHGVTEMYRTVLVGNPHQSGTDSFGTNSDRAAQRMMPGGDLYKRATAKLEAGFGGKLPAAPNPGNATPATASASGGGALPAAGGADVNAALLQAIQAASGGGSSSADLVPLISGLSGESAFIGAASAQQKRLDGMIDDLGRSLAPREATAERRFAYSPFFSQALNLLG